MINVELRQQPHTGGTDTYHYWQVAEQLTGIVFARSPGYDTAEDARKAAEFVAKQMPGAEVVEKPAPPRRELPADDE